MASSSNPEFRPVSVLRDVRPPIGYIEEDEKNQPLLTRLPLSLGVSPFGPPRELHRILNDIVQYKLFERSMEAYQVDDTQSIQYVRERFGLSEDPYITFSSGGSHEILERIISQLLPYPRPDKRVSKIHLISISPHFPEVVTFSDRSPGLLYGSLMLPRIEDLFDKTARKFLYNERVSELVDKNDPRKNVVYYIDNPNNPTGAVANSNTMEGLARSTAKHGQLLIIDEAFGDALPDDVSAIPLTGIYPNLIVTRSFSKIIGLPGERIGYAVMSEEVGKKFENVRRFFDLVGTSQVIANHVLNPKILNPHLNKVRKLITDIKVDLMRGLDSLGVSYADTDSQVPIILINGKHSNFYQIMKTMSIDTAPGKGFRRTDHRMSDQFVRLTIPKNRSELSILIRRIQGALYYDK